MKKLLYLTFLATLCSTTAIADQNSTDVQNFKKTWVAQALALQRQIDINAPLNQATFLGTHNSENSFSYQIPFVRYVDPNQILSIYDQLEMGIRSLEFDVHWYTGTKFKKDILLSHALNNHLGCSVFDRPVVSGLKEIAHWLAKNPREVVILYFDRGTALDGHEPLLANYLEKYLGSYIYKASAVRDANAKPASCVSLPGTMTKAQVLRAGKQLLIITKACSEFPLSEFNWTDYVFAGMGNVKKHEFNFLDSTIGDDFTPYPDCSKTTVFADDPEHTVPWRIFEDRTIIGNLNSPGRKILIPEIKTMVDCGINWQTMDMLSANDERLAAAVWSWAPNFPKTGTGDCAAYKNGEGVENIACAQQLAAFACKQENTQSFKAVLAQGSWQDGETNCQLLAGKDWHFAMPINGNQMYLFKQMVTLMNMDKVWLNYHTNKKGLWQATA